MRWETKEYGFAKCNVVITDEHSASSYGVPVVLVDGELVGDLEVSDRADGDTGYEIKENCAMGRRDSYLMKGVIVPDFIRERDIRKKKEWDESGMGELFGEYEIE